MLQYSRFLMRLVCMSCLEVWGFQVAGSEALCHCTHCHSNVFVVASHCSQDPWEGCNGGGYFAAVSMGTGESLSQADKVTPS